MGMQMRKSLEKQKAKVAKAAAGPAELEGSKEGSKKPAGDKSATKKPGDKPAAPKGAAE